MRNIQGKVPESALSRFLLGAGIGIAISVPLFIGIEDVPVRVLFMLAFAGIMGTGQVLAGGKSERSRTRLTWSLVAGVATLLVGVLVFFLVS